MACVIKVDQVEIDVEELYRKAGFEVLPPQLTISGQDLKAAGNVPWSYNITRAGDMDHISDGQAVPVKHGDQFTAFPRASY